MSPVVLVAAAAEEAHPAMSAIAAVTRRAHRHADRYFFADQLTHLHFPLDLFGLDFAHRAHAFALMVFEAANVDHDVLLAANEFAHGPLALVDNRLANGDFDHFFLGDRDPFHDATGPFFDHRDALTAGIAAAALIDAGHAHRSAHGNLLGDHDALAMVGDARNLLVDQLVNHHRVGVIHFLHHRRTHDHLALLFLGHRHAYRVGVFLFPRHALAFED